MKLLFIYGIALAIFSFLFACSSSEYSPPDYVKIANGITAKTSKKLEEQKKLYLVGVGGGMMDDIQVMSMSFDYYQEVDLKEARNLMVFAIHEYLSDINDNEEVRPYLHDCPFTAKNVEIRVWIYNPDRSKLSPEKIHYFSALDGILAYYIPGPKKYSRLAICEETYEEALKIVNSEE